VVVKSQARMENELVMLDFHIREKLENSRVKEMVHEVVKNSSLFIYFPPPSPQSKIRISARSRLPMRNQVDPKKEAKMKRRAADKRVRVETKVEAAEAVPEVALLTRATNLTKE